MLPLLPTQRRWVDPPPIDMHHFNLGWLFTVAPEVTARSLAAPVTRLLAAHPALRTAYRRAPAGWTTDVLTVAADAVIGPGELPDYRGEPDSLQQELRQAQATLDPAQGRVLRILHFPFGPEPGRVAVLVHHLTLDGFSMGLLADTLDAELCDRPRPSGSATPAEYAQAAVAWADGAEAGEDLVAWQKLAWESVELPRPDRAGAAMLPSLRLDTVTVPAARTAELTAACRRDRMSLAEVALAAVGRAVTSHYGLTGVTVDTYHQGRSRTPSGIDVVDTIGYVQNTFPVVLPAGGEALDAVRAVPPRMFGFDALRYAGTELADLPASVVRFNFRGQLGRLDSSRGGGMLGAADEPLTGLRSARQVERYLLMWEGDLVDGELLLHLKYSTDLLDPGTSAGLLADAKGRLC